MPKSLKVSRGRYSKGVVVYLIQLLGIVLDHFWASGIDSPAGIWKTIFFSSICNICFSIYSEMKCDNSVISHPRSKNGINYQNVCK